MNFKNFIFNLLLLQFVFAGSINAQNWLTTGNVGIGANNYLGTKNNADLVLKTNATEVARFSPMLSGSIGKANFIDPTCSGAFAAGSSNTLNPNSGHSVALGHGNELEGPHEFALGMDNSVFSEYSGCVGVNLRAGADHALTMGIGAGPGWPLENNTPNSIVLGVYQPTMFITETLVSIGNIAPDPFYTLTVSGDVIANNTFLISDRRFKKDIHTLNNALDRVLALRGTQYFFRTDEFKEKNLATGKQFGFIAQEMKEVFPELVHVNDKGEHSINYTGIIPVLVEAMKEQETRIEEKDAAIFCLQNQMENLEARLARLEASLSQPGTDARVFEQPKLEKAFGIAPNPTSGHFQITLSKTAETESSVLLVFDGNGKEVARQSIEAGSSVADVNFNLPNGSYNISLLMHGKLSSTQTLIVAK